jgi:eukaryotic-like serine/threonine-protein kinase
MRRRHGHERGDLMMVLLDGPRRTVPLVQTKFTERNGEVSPDARWLAYESNESGRFETSAMKAERWMVSTGGGRFPVWARSGEMFYLTSEGRLMSVPIRAGSAFAAGTPQVAVEAHYYNSSVARSYDVQ